MLRERKVAWKRVSADIFRAPNQKLIFCVLLGAGAQIICMGLVNFFCALIWGSSNVAGLYLILILYFAYPNGYVAAKFYKFFKGSNWYLLALTTASFYPMFLFASARLMDWLDV